MNAITKREQLWRDRHSMEECLESKLFQALHELYVNIVMREPPLFPIDEVQVLNEVGYSVAWLQQQSTFTKHVDMEQLLRNAYAMMSVKYYAHIVVCLTWASVKLVQFPAIYINKEASKVLERMVGQCWCGDYTKVYVRKLCREGVFYMESFENSITWMPLDAPATFDLTGEEVRGLIAAEDRVQESMVEDSMTKEERTFTLAKIVEEAKKLFPLEHAFTLVFMLNKMMENDSTEEERQLVSGIIEHIIKRKAGIHVDKQFNVTLNNSQIDGPMYDISGNDNVNIGGNGQESK